jgi:hypothetical protein
MTNQNVTTVSEALASCSFTPSSYGYRGVSVTQFAFSGELRLYGFNFDPIAGVLSVQTASNGVIQCVLRYLPPAEVALLCDAVSAAVAQSALVRLARVPQAGPRWFCGLVLSSEHKEPEVTTDPRPWSTWKA